MSRSARHRPVVLVAAVAAVLALALPAVAAGPPYPDPVNDQAVYDTADALSAATEARAEVTIDAIEQRTGAEVVVYTQLVPPGWSDDQAESDARALMDQWGVGRKGIDDGLVILFELYDGDRCHGRVQLYAGPGYRGKYLTNEERQAVFEDDMVPRLRECDLDGALLVALERVDAAATPAHASELNFARQLNAVLGLLVAPFALIGVLAWGAWEWLRFGKDPVYLDDPSIHIPAPPAGLTPAAGAVVRDGRATRRALTAASLDLASRGQITFEPETTGLIIRRQKIGIRTTDAPVGDDVEMQSARYRAERRPMDAATRYLDQQLDRIGGSDGYIEPERILELGEKVSKFDEHLEAHVVNQGWFRERPGEATKRWLLRGGVVAILGAVAFFVGLEMPSDGIVLVGIALGAAGIGLLVLSRSMPARTMPGAMIRAMLEAYRRTLQKTMEQARSMDQVVAESAIPLLETPDDAVVWGVALGLQEEVEEVLKRTADDLKDQRASTGYLPAWYGGASSGGGSGSGGGGWAPGLMSSSPVPNFGGMMAALSTIGNSPSSSGSGGGGFGGGGSGGGGGGAGGGF